MYWNPDPIAFTIPFINLSIYIYGICFVAGFSFGYLILKHLMQIQYPFLEKSILQKLLDQVTWFIIAGTIVGARLGHVFFYDWERYREAPWLILNTREGGLASHGGTIGVLIALFIFYRLYFHRTVRKTFLELIDLIVVPTALVAFFIRLGNFFNQEIVGIPTDLPWGIVFGSPADHHSIAARHPVQLYEGFSYLVTFGLLYYLWKQKAYLRTGVLSGIFFLSIFGSRFFIEFLKAKQISVFDQTYLQAGQWLSLPFILGGFFLLLYGLRNDYRQQQPPDLHHKGSSCSKG